MTLNLISPWFKLSRLSRMCELKSLAVKKLKIINFIDDSMSSLEQISILDFPDEIIEEMMTFLKFSDISNLRQVGKRFEDCARRVMKKMPFSMYIIQIVINSYYSFYKNDFSVY